MSSYHRPRVTGATIFFTVCLHDRRLSLLTDHIAVLRDAVRITKSEHPFEIVAMVVLPDHLHCVWRLPTGDRAYGKRWGAIKGRFSRGVRMKGGVVGASPTLRSGCRVGLAPTNGVDRRPSQIAKQESGIWQRRFWEHHIRSEEDLANHVRYCHFNPVKHGYVARPEEWRWSSVHREMRLGRFEGEALSVGWG